MMSLPRTGEMKCFTRLRYRYAVVNTHDADFIRTATELIYAIVYQWRLGFVAVGFPLH
jgi:hypothetical protein